jgi:ArsR family transcriptional regulator, cadmium/lead-responsive transcriptional repressor
VGREDDALWAAVGDPIRRQLLDLLLALDEATATRLAERLPVTRQAIAKHLIVLARAGLVESKRDGREVRYKIRPDRLDETSQAMTRLATGWEQRLAAIKRLAESAKAENVDG